MQGSSLCIAHIFEVLTKWPGALHPIYELMAERENQRRLRTPAGTTPGSGQNTEQTSPDFPPANYLILQCQTPSKVKVSSIFSEELSELKELRRRTYLRAPVDSAKNITRRWQSTPEGPYAATLTCTWCCWLHWAIEDKWHAGHQPVTLYMIVCVLSSQACVHGPKIAMFIKAGV